MNAECRHQYWDLGRCIDCFKTQDQIDNERRESATATNAVGQRPEDPTCVRADDPLVTSEVLQAGRLVDPSPPQKIHEELESRMVTMGSTTDSLTASANEPPESVCRYCGGVWAGCDCMHPDVGGVPRLGADYDESQARKQVAAIRQRLDTRRAPPIGTCQSCGHRQELMPHGQPIASSLAVEQWVCQQCRGQISVTYTINSDAPSADEDIQTLLDALASSQEAP